MNRYRIFALLFCSLLFARASEAATTYYWLGNWGGNTHFESASSACAASPTRTRDDGVVFKPAGLKITSATGATCLQTRSDNNSAPSNWYSYSVTRYGDSCSAGYVYNTNTGACEPSVCKAKEGRFLSFASSALLPGSACVGGCSAALPQQHKYTNPKTGHTTYYYDGNYTGNDCSGANPAGYTQCNLEEDCTKDLSAPEVEKSNECQVAETGTDANGKPYTIINCTDTEISQQQQDDNCNWGTVGAGAEGNWTCVTKPGKNNETKTETSTKTTTNPDGSKDTKQTITTTETKCTGANSCTTTTTTTTNSNHTNADGSPGNSSSSCKGTKCPSGNGDGEGEGEEEGDDDIAGPTKQLLGKASQGFGEAETEWQTKIDTARQQLDGLIDQYSNLFSGAFDLNIGTGGGSLPCYHIPITAPNINTTLEFCPAKFEDQLIYLKYILLAAAAILAGFIILRN